MPGVEEAAVHQVFHGVFEIGVGANVGRVFAAELQAHADEIRDGCLLDLQASVHRTREVHLLYVAGDDGYCGTGMTEQQVLEQPFRQIGSAKSFSETLADQQGLRGVFEDHAVARHQRRNNRVDGGQIGVIPRGDHEHRT
ncbi:hypothetical protein D3C84_827350 [compost metagenome]